MAGVVVSILGKKAHQNALPQRVASHVADQFNEIDGKELLKGARELLSGALRKKAPQEALG